MRPFDPRLLGYARTTRGYLLASAGLGVLGVVLIIAQASLLATAITQVFLDGAGLADLRGLLLVLAGVIAGRGFVAWAQDAAAHRCSALVKSELRGRLMAQVVRLGPAWLHGERTGEVTTLLTRGLDALDAYFAKYLPQLVLSALVPAAVLIWVLPVDLVAGVTIAVTLPLIPVFMALVGSTTEQLNRRQFGLLARLSHHLLELISGLATLKVFNRAKAQAEAIRTLTDEQRRLTMRTLRLAFLSSLVLELLATLSVALVAVGIGLRVVGGSLDLRTALLVLILAPEAYLPLRQLGLHYHASTEGLAAASRVFEILDQQPPRRGGRGGGPLPDSTSAPAVVVDDLRVDYPHRPVPAVHGFSLLARPGELVVLAGPSGAGKSTVLAAILGFVEPSAGQVRLGDGATAIEVGAVDREAWLARMAYLPQRPYLFAGTVADNIRLGCPSADHAAIVRAAGLAQLDDLSNGLSTMVGEAGTGLSAGQRQRVGLARVFLRDAGLVLLDEPTANLDRVTERAISQAIRGLAGSRTVIAVSHRPALVQLADRVVRCSPAPAQGVRAPLEPAVPA